MPIFGFKMIVAIPAIEDILALAPSPCPGQSILSPVSSSGEIKFDETAMV